MKLFNIIDTSFKKYDTTIKTYLTKVLGSAGSKYSNSQLFNIIFDGIKGIMQNAMFYIEDAFTEQNVNTAYRKSSLYSLAKLSGYEPYYGSCATGFVNCTINSKQRGTTDSSKIYLKNKSVLLNENTGYSYIVLLPSEYLSIDLDKPLFNTQVKIIQGSLHNTAYVATGEPLEALHIFTNGLFDKEYLEVYVNGVKYTQAACLYDMTENSNEYIVSVGYDNELDIIFGNGIYGKQLEEGQTVNVSYVLHTGEAGNIRLQDNYELLLTSPIYDTNGETISDTSFLTFTLESNISGGTESDTMDNIRKMIGYNSRSLVLASENNFKLFFKRFSFIGQSNIWVDNNSLIINAVCTSNYKDHIDSYTDYFNLNKNDILLSESQKEMVKATLDNSNKAYAGISLNFVDPDIYKYSIITYIKPKSSYDKDTLKVEISNIIANYFMTLDSNTTFISKSEIIKLVLDNVKNIESIDVIFICDNNEIAKNTGYYYTYSKQVVNGTIKYIKTKFIYDSSKPLGLDEFGNIKLNSMFEIPILSNNIQYNVGTNSLLLPAIQFLFIN